MDHNFIISFIIGIVVSALLFLPVFSYISKLTKRPILTINVYGAKVPVNSFIDFAFWKVTYPIINKIYNINKLTEESVLSTGLEKLKLQFKLVDILYKKAPLIHMLIYLSITSIIFWVIFLIISKTIGNILGYIVGSLIIFVINIINTIYIMKKKKKIIIA
ncbi:MAG: hypothetical protein ACO2ON_01715 [Candidatus Nanopusillus sp.]